MDLGYLKITTPLDGTFGFSSWLESDDYIRLTEHFRKQEMEPSCLLDVISFWLERTDGILDFPTFQTFLLAVLEIVNLWQADGPHKVFGIPLWPYENGGGLAIESIAGYDEEGILRDIMSHAIMREENFLMHQTMKRNRHVSPNMD